MWRSRRSDSERIKLWIIDQIGNELRNLTRQTTVKPPAIQKEFQTRFIFAKRNSKEDGIGEGNQFPTEVVTQVWLKTSRSCVAASLAPDEFTGERTDRTHKCLAQSFGSVFTMGNYGLTGVVLNLFWCCRCLLVATTQDLQVNAVRAKIRSGFVNRS